MRARAAARRGAAAQAVARVGVPSEYYYL